MSLPITPHSPPRIEFPEHLPVSARRDDIAAALRAHQVVIICGETGSGKTTQLPKIALAAGRGVLGRVGMTQPRRIAAKSVAQRLAEETGTRLGGFIGWQVRFTDQAGPDTRVKVMTDGILLAETQSDPDFRAYDTLILDEAHERSLNIDFLLGYLKTLLPRRPELKLIVSSATLEADRFSHYFGGAPVIEVSGRTYPVEIRYRPPAERQKPEPETAGKARPEEEEADYDLALLHAVDELAREGQGDILVFLPGEREIRDAQEALRKHHPPHTEILPLFARLSVAEQDQVFQPHAGRRIVLSTNVAETSLTVPGIRYVVDTGLARVKRYSIRNKIEQLKVEKVSQAAANQRAGRCGRVAAGICIRLYDEQDFSGRPAYTTPELLRSSLAGVILRMKDLNLPDIQVFPFLDPPEPKRIRDGHALLQELGALDAADRLTKIGRQLAKLAVDPRIGRILLAARDKACLQEALVIAAFLSCQDPRERPLERQEAADQKHRRFADPNSDFVAILRLWAWLDELNTHRKSQKKFREALKADFLSPTRVREWREIHGQLSVQLKELGLLKDSETKARISPSGVGGGGRVASGPRRPEGVEGDSSVPPAGTGTLSPTPPPSAMGAGTTSDIPAFPPERYAALHQALLPGLLGNVGMLTENGDYLGARGMKFLPFPGSGVKKKPKWLLAAEIVETRRVYARIIARIEPEWLEHAGRHLLKISYADPHWAKKPAHVAATLRATLHGLPVVAGRSVHYGPIEPELCRELFIRGALVAGEFDTRAPFFAHNRRLLAEIDDLAQRTRNVRLEVDDEVVHAFFEARIPAGIHNGAAFDKWRREAEQTQPRLLFLEREDLLADKDTSHADYPKELELNGVRFGLAYRFDPGTEDDGVSLLVPLAALNQVAEARCDWLVPGLLEEKLVALLKSLPQSIRRAFVPVPDFARAAAAALRPDNRPLTEALADFLARSTGVAVPRDAWRPEALPAHLAMNYRVLDESGRVLGEGRDLEALRRRLGGQASAEMQKGVEDLERQNLLAWDLGDLAERVEVRLGKRPIAAFPALLDNAGQVDLKLFDSPHSARAAHRRGVCRLLWLGHAALLKQNEKTLAQRLKAASLRYALLLPEAPRDSLVRDTLIAACRQALGRDSAELRRAADFHAAVEAIRPRLPGETERVAQLAETCIGAAHELGQRLAKAPAGWKDAVADLKAQLAGLIYPGFLADTPPERLAHLPRYLKAMQVRLDKLANAYARDQQTQREMASLLSAWRQRAATPAGRDDPAIEDFRWRLEELRVSLFAQELKTPEPVSVKRLEKRWAEMLR